MGLEIFRQTIGKYDGEDKEDLQEDDLSG